MAVAKKKAAQKKSATKRAAKKAPAKAKKPKAAKAKTAPKKATPKKAVPKKASPKKKAAAPRKAPKKAASRPAASARQAVTSASPTLVHLRGIEPYVEKKGETYMNPRQVKHFHAILNNWKQQLIDEVERTVTHLRDEAANFPDPNDRASQESEFALELRARDRERKLIKKIEESLKDLDNDEYGYCEICGVEIGIRRLEARPTATLCIDCKTLDEIREKQIKG
jgi:DnaK suppressor protein